MRLFRILLLTISNNFMTYAWYGHLRHTERPLLWAILTSWGVALKARKKEVATAGCGIAPRWRVSI